MILERQMNCDELSVIKPEELSQAFANASERDLKLSNTNINIECAKKLALFIETNTILTNLELNNNNLSFEAISIIAASFKSSKTLTKITISNNKLDNHKASLIAEALFNSTTLQHLDFHSNAIQNIYLSKISALIENNHSLKALILKDNIIDDKESHMFSQALQKNSSLVSLDLEGNCFWGPAFLSIIKILKVNSSLMSLNFEGNNLLNKHQLSQVFIETSNSYIIDLKGLDNEIVEERLQDNRKKIKYIGDIIQRFVLYLNNNEGHLQAKEVSFILERCKSFSKSQLDFHPEWLEHDSRKKTFNTTEILNKLEEYKNEFYLQLKGVIKNNIITPQISEPDEYTDLNTQENIVKETPKEFIFFPDLPFEIRSHIFSFCSLELEES